MRQQEQRLSSVAMGEKSNATVRKRETSSIATSYFKLQLAEVLKYQRRRGVESASAGSGELEQD